MFLLLSTFEDKIHSYVGGSKVLVTTGRGSDGAQKTEIVDLEDASFQCTLSQFPTSAYGATGGLVGNTALICGGYSGGYKKSCYSLKEDGAWKLEASSDLNREQ